MQEETCMMKIGMLTSGGDCQALNAAMRGVVKGLTTNVDELEIYGFENGYKGLIYEQFLQPRIFPESLPEVERFSDLPASHSNRCVCRMKTVWTR